MPPVGGRRRPSARAAGSSPPRAAASRRCARGPRSRPRASRSLIGRRPTTSPSARMTGQPRMRSTGPGLLRRSRVVAAADLVDGVDEEPGRARPYRRCTPPGEPGRLTISVRRRARRGRGTAPRSGPLSRRRAARIGLGDARHLAVDAPARSSPGCGRSGERPVPPVVTTTSYPSATAARSAASTGSPSGTTSGPVDREAELAQAVDEHRAAVGPRTRRPTPVRHRDRPARRIDAVRRRSASSRRSCRRSSPRPGRR